MLKKKRAFVLVFLVAVLFFAGWCITPADTLAFTSNSKPAHSASSPFFVLSEWEEKVPAEPEPSGIRASSSRATVYVYHAIMVDNATGVMYHSSTSTCYGGGSRVSISSTFDVLLDTDGAPRVYNIQ